MQGFPEVGTPIKVPADIFGKPGDWYGEILTPPNKRGYVRVTMDNGDIHSFHPDDLENA